VGDLFSYSHNAVNISCKFQTLYDFFSDQLTIENRKMMEEYHLTNQETNRGPKTEMIKHGQNEGSQQRSRFITARNSGPAQNVNNQTELTKQSIQESNDKVSPLLKAKQIEEIAEKVAVQNTGALKTGIRESLKKELRRVSFAHYPD
jgi:hypothetical protein